MSLKPQSAIKELYGKVADEVHMVIVGMDKVIQSIFIALLGGGHVLLEGTPGLAKTYLARAISTALGLDFKRIQFTSDMLPSDISGSLVYNKRDERFEYKRGPIFANIILADEINRAPPRTQSALLEAMQEKQVTMEGIRYPLPDPFIVIATQNPIELEGTYPLPEAELDRFIFRLYLRFPSLEDEVAMLEKKQAVGEVLNIRRVLDGHELASAMSEVQKVHVDRSIMEYMAQLVRETRHDSRVLLGASPRALVNLLYASKARASLEGRVYVTPDDVKNTVQDTFNHRIILKPQVIAQATRDGDIWVYDIIDRILSDILSRVSVPR